MGKVQLEKRRFVRSLTGLNLHLRTLIDVQRCFIASCHRSIAAGEFCPEVFDRIIDMQHACHGLAYYLARAKTAFASLELRDRSLYEHDWVSAFFELPDNEQGRLAEKFDLMSHDDSDASSLSDITVIHVNSNIAFHMCQDSFVERMSAVLDYLGDVVRGLQDNVLNYFNLASEIILDGLTLRFAFLQLKRTYKDIEYFFE